MLSSAQPQTYTNVNALFHTHASHPSAVTATSAHHWDAVSQPLAQRGLTWPSAHRAALLRSTKRQASTDTVSLTTHGLQACETMCDGAFSRVCSSGGVTERTGLGVFPLARPGNFGGVHLHRGFLKVQCAGRSYGGGRCRRRLCNFSNSIAATAATITAPAALPFLPGIYNSDGCGSANLRDLRNGWTANGRGRLRTAASASAALPSAPLPGNGAPEVLWPDGGKRRDDSVMASPLHSGKIGESRDQETPRTDSKSQDRLEVQLHVPGTGSSANASAGDGAVYRSRISEPGSESGTALRSISAIAGLKAAPSGRTAPDWNGPYGPGGHQKNSPMPGSHRSLRADGIGHRKRNRYNQTKADVGGSAPDIAKGMFAGKGTGAFADLSDDNYYRPRKRPAFGPEAAASLLKVATAAKATRLLNSDYGGGSGGMRSIDQLPNSPAKVTRAIKNCANSVQLYQLYRIAQTEDSAVTASVAATPDRRQVVGAHVVAPGRGGDDDDGGRAPAVAVGGALNDLHLVAMLTHLAQLAAAEIPSLAVADRRRVDGAATDATVAAVDVAAFGWEIAMAIGVRLTAGSEVLSQPRAASNSLWAAAKLGLTLRATWWEVLSTPLLDAAAAVPKITACGTSANGTVNEFIASSPLTGRDLCNAVYAVALAATAATGGGDGSGYSDEGMSISPALRRFEGRLRALGSELLQACSSSRLKGCKAQELSSLLYGAGLLRLQPSATWLADSYSPALLAVMPSAGPQVVANILGALQRMDASMPAEITAALLQASKAMLLRTADEATSAAAEANAGGFLVSGKKRDVKGKEIDGTVAAGPKLAISGLPAPPQTSDSTQAAASTAATASLSEPQFLHDHDKQPPNIEGQASSSAHIRILQQQPFPESEAPPIQPQLKERHVLPLPPEMLVTVVWSVGRLSSRGALRYFHARARGYGTIGTVKERSRTGFGACEVAASAAADTDGDSIEFFHSWMAAAVEASVRMLRRHLELADSRRERPLLGPRSLAALASGLALLQVVPRSAASRETDVWRLLYAAAFRLCGKPPLGTVGGSGGSSNSYCRWDPRDVFSLLSAAVSAQEDQQQQLQNPLQPHNLRQMQWREQDQSQQAGTDVVEPWVAPVRPPAELVETLLRQLLPLLQPAAGPAKQAMAARRDLEYVLRGTGSTASAAATASSPSPAPPDDRAASCPDVVLVGCMWALAKLRYRPSQELLAALAIAVRGRIARLPPSSLAQLAWSLGTLQQLSPGQGPHEDSILTLAPGLQRRIRDAVGRVCGGGATPAAAAAISSSAALVPAEAEGHGTGDDLPLPPPMPPRTVVQLVRSLRQLRIPIPPMLAYRIALALVKPALQQLSQELRHRRGQFGGDPGDAASHELRVLATDFYTDVRLLGALAAAMAGLCDSVPAWQERNTSRDVSDGASGAGNGFQLSYLVSNRLRLSQRRHRGGGGSGAARGSVRSFHAPPLDLRRTGLRLSLLEAGRIAMHAAASLAEVHGLQEQQQRGLPLPSVALRDWSSYLAGLRRMGFRPSPKLVSAMVEYLAGPGPSVQLKTCSARELVALACELSHAVATTSARRSRYSVTKLHALRRHRGLPQKGQTGGAVDVVLEHGGTNQTPAAMGKSVENGHSVNPQAGVRDAANAHPIDSGFKIALRRRRLRVIRLVRARVGPALLAAAQRIGDGAVAEAAIKGCGGGHQGSGGAIRAAGKEMVSERLAATLLRALWRLGLRPPPTVVAAFMHSAAASGSWRRSRGRTALSDFADSVQMALAVAAAMPALPTITTKSPVTMGRAEATAVQFNDDHSSAVSTDVEWRTISGLTTSGVYQSKSGCELPADLKNLKTAGPEGSTSTTSAGVVLAAADWLAHVVAMAEVHLLLASPVVLLEEVLPLVTKLFVGAQGATWIHDAVQSRVLPATFAACIRALRGGGARLSYISSLLDALLGLTAAQATDRRNRSTVAGGDVDALSRRMLHRSDSSHTVAAVLRRSSPPVVEVQLPDDLWVAVYRASYQQMATALPQAAAVAAATIAPVSSPAGRSMSSSAGHVTAGSAEVTEGDAHNVSSAPSLDAAAVAAASKPAARSNSIECSGGGRTTSAANIVLGQSVSRSRDGQWVNARSVTRASDGQDSNKACSGSGNTGCVAVSSFSTKQVVALAYSLARHPPRRPPPDRWMRLMLLAVEADLASLGARDCADLCVSLVRLGCVPGSGWLDRFGLQVALTRALTEKTEHTLLSQAWLGLRQLRDHHQQRQQQQQGEHDQEQDQ